MPDVHPTNGLSPREMSWHGCPKCGSPVSIQTIAPGRPGFEHWTIRCSKCGLIHEAQVQAEPAQVPGPRLAE